MINRIEGDASIVGGPLWIAARRGVEYSTGAIWAGRAVIDRQTIHIHDFAAESHR